jgi:hypothetical protein
MNISSRNISTIPRPPSSEEEEAVLDDDMETFMRSVPAQEHFMPGHHYLGEEPFLCSVCAHRVKLLERARRRENLAAETVHIATTPSDPAASGAYYSTSFSGGSFFSRVFSELKRIVNFHPGTGIATIQFQRSQQSRTTDA